MVSASLTSLVGYMRQQLPAHHLAAEQLNDRSQVQPALAGLDLGDVITPELVGLWRIEVPLLHRGLQGRLNMQVSQKADHHPTCASAVHQVFQPFLS